MEKFKYILHNYKYRILLISLFVFLWLFLSMSYTQVTIYITKNAIFQLASSIIIATSMIVTYTEHSKWALWYGMLSIWLLRFIWPGGNPQFDAIIWWSIIFFFMRMNRLLIKIIIKEKHIGNDLLIWCITWYMMIAISGFFFFMILDGICNQQWFTMSATASSNRLFSMLYYSFVTLTTVGYGDITPANSLMQSATVIYSIVWRSYTTFVLAMVLKKFE